MMASMERFTIFSDEVMAVSVWNNLAIFDCAGMWHASHVGDIARASWSSRSAARSRR